MSYELASSSTKLVSGTFSPGQLAQPEYLYKECVFLKERSLQKYMRRQQKHLYSWCSWLVT
jgi:hypothetical protein